jgi:hypothetical protein
MVSPEKFGLPEIYRFYKNKFTFRERKDNGFVSRKVHNSILNNFNKELSDLIICKGLEFTMPLRLGTLRVRKYKRAIRLFPDGTIDKRKMNVDWNATKKMWCNEYPGKTMQEIKLIHPKKVVYFLNEHTDGYRYLLYWNKKGSNAINRKVYSVRFTRDNDRLLAKVLKTDNQICFYE